MDGKEISGQLSVSASSSGQRLDFYLAERQGEISRSLAQRLIENGRVQVNSGPCLDKNYRVKIGDRICFSLPPLQEPIAKPEVLPLDIIFEDSYLLVVNKPRGMVVHPAPGHSSGTLVNALLYHCADLSGIGGVARPGIVHRLDKDTSGLLLVAKNDPAHSSLSSQLKNRQLQRQYIALVCGRVIPAAGRIEAPIGRHPRNRKKMAVIAGGREAVTRYRVLKEYEHCSLLQLNLETGRTHQIRVHLAQHGNPVVGDFVYGQGICKGVPAALLFKHALHAFKLSFSHPRNKEKIELQAPLPLEFRAILRYLARKN